MSRLEKLSVALARMTLKGEVEGGIAVPRVCPYPVQLWSLYPPRLSSALLRIAENRGKTQSRS